MSFWDNVNRVFLNIKFFGLGDKIYTKTNDMQSYEDAVLKVATWWSDKFRSVMNQNNGDKSGSTATNLLLNMVSDKAKVNINDEKIKKFESKLSELLGKAGKYDRTLSVDYHPCEILSKAAEFAGIDSYCFPCKSYTRIDSDNNAYAKYQYGGMEVKL